MPIYTFRNIETNELMEVTLKIAELDKFKLDNPHLEKQIDSPSIGDPMRLGRTKIDNGFREVLSKISERTHGGKALKDSIR